jgi:membrane protease YdiL (CAAX protease family)
MKIKEFARRHPVGVYFCLAFFVSWVGSLITAGPIFLRGESMEPQDLWATGTLMLAGPFLAGLAMTYLVSGNPGLQDLFSRMRRWRFEGRWYAALLIFPTLILAVSLALSAWAYPELSPTFFAPGILMGLFAGLIEEVGWMGFAFPAMQSKRSILGATIYLGFLHALWHVVADFLGNYRAFGGHWLPYFVGFFVFVMALRVLIVWVYVNTRSLLLAQLMHASSSGFLSILIPISIAPVNWVVFYCVYAVILSVVALTVVARYGRDLTRRPHKANVISVRSP